MVTGFKKFSLTASAKVFTFATALVIALPVMMGAAEAAGISGVHIGASVKFRHFELVKMLDGYFTLETRSQTANPYHTQTIEDCEVLVVL